MVNYIYTNLQVNAIVRLAHPLNGDSQVQEMFEPPLFIIKTQNYSKHHPSLSTPMSKEFSHSKMEWWAIYIQIYK